MGEFNYNLLQSRRIMKLDLSRNASYWELFNNQLSWYDHFEYMFTNSSGQFYFIYLVKKVAILRISRTGISVLQTVSDTVSIIVLY